MKGVDVKMQHVKLLGALSRSGRSYLRQFVPLQTLFLMFGVLMFGRQLMAVAFPLAFFLPAATHASPVQKWDGTWTGDVEDIGPVSVTIARGEVVGYAICGSAPYGIKYSKVTLTTVSFGDHDNYDVKISKTGANTAKGTARSVMGERTATLSKE
jgi:hypothetical protein